MSLVLYWEYIVITNRSQKLLLLKKNEPHTKQNQNHRVRLEPRLERVWDDLSVLYSSVADYFISSTIYIRV